jgi:hypothetical protein
LILKARTAAAFDRDPKHGAGSFGGEEGGDALRRWFGKRNASRRAARHDRFSMMFLNALLASLTPKRLCGAT